MPTPLPAKPVILPEQPPPPAPGFLVVFSPAQWTWISSQLQAIYVAQDLQMQTTGPMTNALERLLTQSQEFADTLAENTAQTAANTAATTANTEASTREVAQLQDVSTRLATAIADLAAAGVTPEQLVSMRQISTDLSTSTAALAASTAAMAGDDPATPTV